MKKLSTAAVLSTLFLLGSNWADAIELDAQFNNNTKFDVYCTTTVVHGGIFSAGPNQSLDDTSWQMGSKSSQGWKMHGIGLATGNQLKVSCYFVAFPAISFSILFDQGYPWPFAHNDPQVTFPDQNGLAEGGFSLTGQVFTQGLFFAREFADLNSVPHK